ncbi:MULTISPECIES: helix-turn-helix domain-containing protein [Pseudomonas]|uniref:Helix-turn-helix domain-containing protein n=1 Tax=Pseudomonas helleri TaxID=1608996 RepID=A0A6A7YFL9_9PSED|nr:MULTISPECIES: helix-turn-helix transcriptional regulator [Pseudomonas]MQT26052.1 helix-turn-helix domain-containing protein [Pseudomonas helleri]MQT31405.1 helix-turn-helix domain-containing protein [Pseudomonas helleri]MQU17837.1 helix-turn-helix domain-containing protein [Pseudomonas helleri]
MNQIDYQAIGERLRAFRIGRQLNADQVAEKLGISRAAVYRLELGKIVKLETLERLAALLKVSLTSLLGSDTEYFDNALGYFERMRQLEARSSSIISYFDPFSYLLTTPEYSELFKTMLYEARPRGFSEAQAAMEDQILSILDERKSTFFRQKFQVKSIVSLRQIERYLHIGLVGRLNLPTSVRMERALLARREIENLINIVDSNSDHPNIYLIDEALPSATFQIFEQKATSYVAVSPYRLGELPNLHVGIASVTSSTQAVDMYKTMSADLLGRAYSGRDATQKLTQLLTKL